MALRRAIGTVKDQTSISLAKVNNYSDSLSELEIAIVKATRHDEYPSKERHVREIVGLTHYSRHFVSACVGTIARRLNKTRNWVVALKSLMLIQRLLEEGEAAYEQEIFFSTRRGTRLLNLSDFRDATGQSNTWDYSAFVRTYALYLDERLEYRMQERRKSGEAAAAAAVEDGGDSEGSEEKAAPAKELNVDQLVFNMLPLQQLLDRFLATRPAGAAKSNRLALVALYSVVKESFQIYYDITYMLAILIRMFMDLDVSDAVKVHEVFYRSSKQFDELESYYAWCKDVGITRLSEYPEIERITPKQLEKMDDFIRKKSSEPVILDLSIVVQRDEAEEDICAEDFDAIKALPAPEEDPKEEDGVRVEERKPETPRQHEGDLLNLWDEPMTSEQHGEHLSLVLFNGAGPGPGPGSFSGSVWDAFKGNDSDWETELVQSTSYLPQQRTRLGGGLDMLVLNGLYAQGKGSGPVVAQGSASSVAFGSAGNPPPPMLALPAPPVEEGGSDSFQTKLVPIDPFGPSMAVPPPSYVQMSELERKQQFMMEEQIMWRQYERNGMQGHIMDMVGYNTQLQGQNPYQNGHRYNW
ncbi:hypothetical protein V2J09_008191 [Rumex salicifolius]